MKKPKIAIWMATAFVAVSLTACSGGGNEVAPNEAAPEVETSSSQTVSEACLEMSGPLSEASSAIAGIASVSTEDPQAAVDSWTELADAYGTISESVSNPEVKSAVGAVHTDLTSVRDAMQTVYVDGDTGALEDFTTASTEMQTSYTSLMELCAP